ncbi:MAG TPA: CPBP family intramembrane glutamic endopeptidase [Acidimicrobiales bacterium]|jgi:membrane protease YdiL (CAAX protease family)|nr:CPBP family intramembrane glutamic endopeptidase [Acidimicrobiales bacterium]
MTLDVTGTSAGLNELAPPAVLPAAMSAPAAASPPPPEAKQRRSGSRPVTDSKLRRLYGLETWVVLSIFPLGATLTAITFLCFHWTTGSNDFDAGAIIPHQPVLTVALSCAYVLSDFAAAALVLFLLFRNGEGSRSIGLDKSRLRKDLALMLPIWIFVFVVPQFIGIAIVKGAHLPTFGVASPPVPTGFVAVGVLRSLSAGVVEEIVVLGYLLRRLEQRGWSPTVVVLVAVLVRVSYHLYYGPGVIPIVLWATASVIMYRRVRRLLPFILCHFAWDANITLHHYTRVGSYIFGGTFFLSILVACIFWTRKDSGGPEIPELSLLSPPSWAA